MFQPQGLTITLSDRMGTVAAGKLADMLHGICRRRHT
jgi:hypothetical protein